MRKKDHEPHDAVFKAFFSDAIIARNYLLHYTAEDIYGHIDFSVFQKIDTAFVSGRFGISFSDVLYESRLLSGAPVRLLFLFEHKSYVPKWPIHLPVIKNLPLKTGPTSLLLGSLSIGIPVKAYCFKR
jgi:hypothetical protein